MLVQRRLLKVPEVASYLGISRAKAWALVNSGYLPSVLVPPRSRRVPLDVLENWVQQQLQSAPAKEAADGDAE